MEKFNATLQENLITVLAYDDVHGKLVAQLATSDLFEGDYRLVAEKCMEYWRVYAEAPKVHTADLFADILNDAKNRRGGVFKRILSNMAQLAPSMNTVYVLNQLRSFTRLQRLKDAILKAANELNARQEMAIDEVESMWNDLLRSRQVDFETGSRLHDIEKVVNYQRTHFVEFNTGIKELDKRRIGPARGSASVFIGPTGTGKSWWLVHLAKQALMQRKKVLHVSLEMPEEQVLQRYYQSFFSVSKYQMDVPLTGIERDSMGRVEGFVKDTYRPEFAFDSPYLIEELETRITELGSKASKLIVKKFPTRRLTPNLLQAYLDNLEVVEKFSPDLMLIDYLGIMWTDPKNHRISLGRNFEELRGIADERNCALEAVHQTSKLGAMAQNVEAIHGSEDWSITNTADQIYTYSQTKAEKSLGLARLFVSKARNEQDKFGVLLTQNYAIGQFALDSALLTSHYFDRLQEFSDDEQDAQGGEEDDGQED